MISICQIYYNFGHLFERDQFNKVNVLKLILSVIYLGEIGNARPAITI